MEMTKARRSIVLVILGVIGGLMFLMPYIRYSFYDQMMEALQFNDLQMGNIGLIYGISCFACYLVSGYLADRFAPKQLILVGTGGMAATTFWYAAFPPFWGLAIIHVLYGVFSIALCWCAYLKAIRQLYPADQQSKAYGFGQSIRGIGQTIVAFIGLAAMERAVDAAAGFRAVVLTNAAAFTVTFFTVLFLYPAGSTAHQSISLRESILKMLSYLKKSAIWIMIFIIMSGYTVWTTASNYLGTYCTRVLKMPDAMSSFISIMRNYVIIIIAGVIGGIVLDKFRKKGTGLMIFFGAALMFSAMLFVTGNKIVVGVAMILLIGFSVNAIISTYWSCMGSAGIDVNETGLASGVISLVAFTTDIFTPAIVSRLIQHGEDTGRVADGFHAMLLWLAAWCALGMIASALLRNRQTKLEKSCAAASAPQAGSRQGRGAWKQQSGKGRAVGFAVKRGGKTTGSVVGGSHGLS